MAKPPSDDNQVKLAALAGVGTLLPELFNAADRSSNPLVQVIRARLNKIKSAEPKWQAFLQGFLSAGIAQYLTEEERQVLLEAYMRSKETLKEED